TKTTDLSGPAGTEIKKSPGRKPRALQLLIRRSAEV
ncbi:MAG: hypothetical protein ACI9CV_002310, partial [Ilumatobacter sp.]